MGIFDEGESAEVKSIFKYLSDPNNWLAKSKKELSAAKNFDTFPKFRNFLPKSFFSYTVKI